jgi:hypothetical protein
MLVVGEPHGVRETSSALYALATALDTRAVAFEWSHEEMDVPVQEFVRTGRFDFEQLWSLPASAEFFCGDGRITAGHFALLQRLRDEDRLRQAIMFDRLDTDPPPADWRVRDREMAERLLGEWDASLPLLVSTGAFHARLDVAAGETMATHLSRRLPGLQPVVLHYASGRCWSRGEHDVTDLAPQAGIVLGVASASPAIVPGPAG